MRKSWEPDLETFSFGKKYDNAPFTKQRLKEAIYWEMMANGEVNWIANKETGDFVPLIHKYLKGEFLQYKDVYTYFNIIPNFELVEWDSKKDAAALLKKDLQEDITEELKELEFAEEKVMSKSHKDLKKDVDSKTRPVLWKDSRNNKLYSDDICYKYGVVIPSFAEDPSDDEILSYKLIKTCLCFRTSFNVRKRAKLLDKPNVCLIEEGYDVDERNYLLYEVRKEIGNVYLEKYDSYEAMFFKILQNMDDFFAMMAYPNIIGLPNNSKADLSNAYKFARIYRDYLDRVNFHLCDNTGVMFQNKELYEELGRPIMFSKNKMINTKLYDVYGKDKHVENIYDSLCMIDKSAKWLRGSEEQDRWGLYEDGESYSGYRKLYVRLLKEKLNSVLRDRNEACRMVEEVLVKFNEVTNAEDIQMLNKEYDKLVNDGTIIFVDLWNDELNDDILSKLKQYDDFMRYKIVKYDKDKLKANWKYVLGFIKMNQSFLKTNNVVSGGRWIEIQLKSIVVVFRLILSAQQKSKKDRSNKTPRMLGKGFFNRMNNSLNLLLSKKGEKQKYLSGSELEALRLFSSMIFRSAAPGRVLMEHWHLSTYGYITDVMKAMLLPEYKSCYDMRFLLLMDSVVKKEFLKSLI